MSWSVEFAFSSLLCSFFSSKPMTSLDLRALLLPPIPSPLSLVSPGIEMRSLSNSPNWIMKYQHCGCPWRSNALDTVTLWCLWEKWPRLHWSPKYPFWVAFPAHKRRFGNAGKCFRFCICFYLLSNPVKVKSIVETVQDLLSSCIDTRAQVSARASADPAGI